MTAYETISYAVDRQVLTITLNRPEHLNAMTVQMALELVDAFDRADADDAVRVVIVTGAGRAFCAGADLSSGPSTFAVASEPARRDFGGLITLRIYRSLKPVIAAVNGAAVGAGASMVLPMDMRLASTAARTGFVFARRGIAPESASAFFLPRVVGISRAMEWCVVGRLVPADEAQQAGLYRSVHAPGDLLAAARELAEQVIANTAPVSVALTRQMLWRGLEMDHPMQAHRLDSRVVASRGISGDAREGVASFLGKRAPAFPDTVARDMPELYPWWVEPEYR